MPPVIPRSSFLPVNVMAGRSFMDSKGYEENAPAMGISSWPASERPRERLLAKGAGALTDAELVAVLLRTGVRGKSAVDLAREMIERFKGVKGLLAPGADLQAIKALGGAKRASLAAPIAITLSSMHCTLRSGASLTSRTAL